MTVEAQQHRNRQKFSLAKLFLLVTGVSAYLGIPALCAAVSPDLYWSLVFASVVIFIVAIVACPIFLLLILVVLITPESSREFYRENLMRSLKMLGVNLLLLVPISSFLVHSMTMSVQGKEPPARHSVLD